MAWKSENNFFKLHFSFFLLILDILEIKMPNFTEKVDSVDF